MAAPTIIVIAHDMRSTHNVGSLLRTADGLGVSGIYFTGYTPYPKYEGDTRLPHIARKLDAQIRKTALGAETSVRWEHAADLRELVGRLQGEGFLVCALEQSEKAVPLPDFRPAEGSKVCLLLGNETAGLDADTLGLTDTVLEIPMSGSKESFNVIQAAAMALYHLRFPVRS